MSEINYSKMFSLKWSLWPISMPTYGNYGGQNWSGGRYVRDGQPTDFSVNAKNALDQLFKIHDIGYANAQNHQQRLVADRILLQGLIELRNSPEWNLLPIQDKAYAISVAPIFTMVNKAPIIGRNDQESIRLIAELTGKKIEDINNDLRNSNWIKDTVQNIYNAAPNLPRCFPGSTLISLPGGGAKRMDAIEIGDIVETFDPHANGGRGALLSGVVTRLFENVTQEWLVVTLPPEKGGTARRLIATPGHETLRPEGGFAPLQEMVRWISPATGTVSLVNRVGEVTTGSVERVIYSAATAHLFEQATMRVAGTSGTLALKPTETTGWKTYNFEVRGTHTYVAEGIRVHNDSAPDVIEKLLRMMALRPQNDNERQVLLLRNFTTEKRYKHC